MCYKYIVTFVTDNHCVFNETGDWSNGMIGVSKTFGGSSILSSPALTRSVEHSKLTYFIISEFVCFIVKINGVWLAAPFYLTTYQSIASVFVYRQSLISISLNDILSTNDTFATI